MKYEQTENKTFAHREHTTTTNQRYTVTNYLPIQSQLSTTKTTTNQPNQTPTLRRCIS